MALPSKVSATVQQITSHGSGVYTVVFEVPSRYTRFSPGQFLHLTLEEFDPTTGYWPESRVFSIASAPRQDSVSIVYSVKGQYTRRMEAELAVGRSIWLKFPYGDFLIDEELRRLGPVVLVGGGTGVSPFRPFLLADRTGDEPIHLYYGIRQPEHLLFGEDWARLQEKPWFRLHLWLEDGAVPGQETHRGRLSIEQICRDLGTEFAQGNYFLSGPPGMIRTFQEDLIRRNIAPQQIHIDEWE